MTARGTRQAFATVLCRLHEEEAPINLASVALSLDVSTGLLSRYLSQFRQLGYVRTRRGFVGLYVTIVDRQGLQNTAEGVRGVSGEVVGAPL